MFIGRTEELQRLKSFFLQPGEQVGLVYGRRRVGKTRLLTESAKDCPDLIYVQCDKSSEAANVEIIQSVLSEKLGTPKLGYNDFRSLLKYIFDLSVEKDIVLILDEYNYLKEDIKGVDSILQSLIDQYQDSSNMKLILCGSYIDVMKSLLEAENPLYKRFTFRMHLHPMDYFESALFYPERPPEDKIRLYSVFGGIPFYNRLVRSDLSVTENIQLLVTSSDAILADESGYILSTEISKIANAEDVLTAIARGASKYTDILNRSHAESKGQLNYVLNKLQGMEIIEKVCPINDKNNAKRAYYRILDPFMLFYYRFVSRNQSQTTTLSPQTFYKRYIEDSFETEHVPAVFEQICRQYLIRRNRHDDLKPFFEEIGTYYYDIPARRAQDGKNHNGQFDLVTRDGREYVFYEVKFRKRLLTRSLILEEISQVNECGLPCTQYGFFSRSGFECEPEYNWIFYTLDDLYSDHLNYKN